MRTARSELQGALATSSTGQLIPTPVSVSCGRCTLQAGLRKPWETAELSQQILRQKNELTILNVLHFTYTPGTLRVWSGTFPLAVAASVCSLSENAEARREGGRVGRRIQRTGRGKRRTKYKTRGKGKTKNLSSHLI